MSTLYIKYPGITSIPSGVFPLLAPDGSVSAPSYANSTGNTGIYFSGETILISANQGNVATFSAAGDSIKGTTTNNSASAGFVGESVISTVSNASPLSLTSTSSLTIASISLTAGDWNISASAGYIPASTTGVVNYIAAISTTDATLPSGSTTEGIPDATGQIRQIHSFASFVPGGGHYTLGIPSVRAAVASTTIYYLVVNASFNTSTMTGFGGIWARRVR